jgi:uncharacterized membrane protein YcfT
MGPTPSADGTPARGRIDWIDYAKGFCIVFVVGWHSTLGVEGVAGRESWLHAAVVYTTPFRMPDFFLISGLFLARAIDKDWRSYLDRRVLHFVYFYVLWLTIQLGFKAPMIAQESGWLAVLKLYALSFIDPFGHLWFIYLLPVFFVLTKLLRNVSPLIVWPVAAALEIAHIDSDWTLILEFPRRFIYFYSGYLFASYVFRLTAAARAWPKVALAALAVWAVVNGVFVAKDWSALPFVSLALGYFGIAALVSASALAANSVLFDPLRYIGEKSLYIYLAFIFPMAAARIVLFKSGVITDLGVVALVVTAAGLAGALAIYWVLRDTRYFGFLFERPQRFYIPPKKRLAWQPAE